MNARGPLQSLAASPTMVGAITTLIVIVAVFLAYNANNGLPFVPVYRVSVEVPNAARLVRNNEVRVGGHRVGVIESIEAAQARSGAVASVNLKLDKTAEPLPVDSIFRVRYKSAFGLKFLEVIRGTGEGAAEGFQFDGTDDDGVCKLPVTLETFAAEVPASARNGCFQPQTEFDDLASVFDRRTRARLRTTLVGFGDGVAGRGVSVAGAIESLGPLMRQLRPVAAVLADPDSHLPRLIEGLRATAAATAPVAEQAARLFTNAGITFEAISRDPEALAEAISEAVPLLEQGTPQLHRQRLLLTDVAALVRRLNPGARALPEALPVLNDALAIGTPVLRRVPRAARDLRPALVELRRIIDQPATGVTLLRLRETFEEALPLIAHFAPAQTVCNYWNYWTTFLPEHFSQRTTVGFSQRNSVTVPHPTDPGSVSIAGTAFDFPGTTKTPVGGYSGIPANGQAGPFPDPAEEGLFKPRELPILHAPLNAPTGQLTDEYPDCAPGQFGYPLGQLLLPGQPISSPAIGVGDYPGSVGPTTLFYRQDGTRELRDTRVRSRAPTTWEGVP